MNWQNDDFPDEEETDPRAQLKPGPSSSFPSPNSGQMPAAPDTGSSPGVPPNTGNFGAPGQPPVQQRQQNPQPNPQQGFQTGGFSPAPNPTPSGGVPLQSEGASPGGSNPTPSGGGSAQSGFRTDTTGFVPVQPKRSQTPITPRDRVIYAGAGFGVGVILGLMLGVLNSILEGISIMGGLGLTLQIAVWLGLVIGIVTAWRPRRFDAAFERLKAKITSDG